MVAHKLQRAAFQTFFLVLILVHRATLRREQVQVMLAKELAALQLARKVSARRSLVVMHAIAAGASYKVCIS